MKSLTIKQLRKDKAHYEELLSQKRGELADLQFTIARLEGAYIYVTQNLTAIEDTIPGVFIEGQRMENMEYIPEEEK